MMNWTTTRTHQQIIGCLVALFVAATLALASDARAQYGDPFNLQPLDPYDPLYNTPPTPDYYERRPDPPGADTWPAYELNEPYDTQDALRGAERQNCDFMTGNPYAQQRCYESLR